MFFQFGNTGVEFSQLVVVFEDHGGVSFEVAGLLQGLTFLGEQMEPLFGGLTSLLGYGLLNAVELATNHRLLGGAFWLFAIPGVFYLIAAWRASRN